MKPSHTYTWTPSHQQQLDDLTVQKARFEEHASPPLMDVIDNHLLDEDEGYSYPRAMLFTKMRENADAIRDALAPFDSGIRCAAPTEG